MQRNDGKLHITFNEMGHGDSVLISLPNGKMVVIDCGSMRWDRSFWNPPQPANVLREHAMRVALADARFLLNSKEIDLLVLTHADKDHCIELGTLFTTTLTDTDPKTKKSINIDPPTKAKQVFYSGDFTDYGLHGVPFTLWNMKKADEIYALTINATASRYGRVTAHNYQGTTLTPTNITASAKNTEEILKKSAVAATLNFVKVLDGTAKKGVACGVYFLASSVEPYANLNDNSTADNRGSIVTLVVYGDKKFLFMGDSTFNTEYFLIQTYGALIKDVELVHIPHHASFNTSSSYPGHPPSPPAPALDFVAHANPRFAVITAAWDSGPQLALPRQEIIDRYHNGARLLSKPVSSAPEMLKVACYQRQQFIKAVKGSSGRAKKKKIVDANVLVEYAVPKHVWCTGSHGPIDFDYEEKSGSTVDRV